MQNPDMINNMLGMLKDPKNRGMIDMMKQQNPNMNIDMFVKAIDYIAKAASAYRKVKSVFANQFF